MTHCETIFSVPLIDDSQVNHYISLGGSYLSKGFSWFGGFVSKGVLNYKINFKVDKAGKYINSKISDNN